MSSITINKTSGEDIYEENRAFDANEIQPVTDIENPTIGVSNSSNTIPILDDVATKGDSGSDGDYPILRVDSGYIQWKLSLADASSWTNLIATSALKGDTGDTGADGANGSDGADGVDGVDADELQVEYRDSDTGWTGTANSPTSSTQYIRMSTDGGSTWSNSIQIKGSDGADGSDGSDGISFISGNFGGTVDDATFLSTTGVAAQQYNGALDTSNNHIWTRGAASWTDGGSIDGADGSAGADGDDGDQWTNGAGAPTSTDINEYDEYYLDTTNKTIYVKVEGASTYSSLFTITGDAYKYLLTSTTIDLDAFSIGDTVSLTVSSGLSYSAGMYVVVSYDDTNYYKALVTSYSGTTLNITVAEIVGTGSSTGTWTVNLAGALTNTVGVAVEDETELITGTSTIAESIQQILFRNNLLPGDYSATGSAGGLGYIAIDVHVTGNEDRLITIDSDNGLQDAGYSVSDLLIRIDNVTQSINGNKTFTGSLISSGNFETSDITLGAITITEISNDTGLTDSSATALVTENAVKTYIDSVALGLNWNDSVLAYQSTTATDPGTPSVGDRYIMGDITPDTNVNTNFKGSYGDVATWISAKSVGEGDIVEWDGTNFIVSVDVSGLAANIAVFIADYEPDSTKDSSNFVYDTTASAWVHVGSSYTDEKAQDAVAGIMTDTSSIEWTYTDGSDTLEADIIDGYLEDHFSSFIQDTTTITWTYDGVANTIEADIDFTGFDTDDITEGGTNLFYTDTRVSSNTTVAANAAHVISTSNPHSVDIDDVTPTTTKGDIIVEDGTNADRLAVGSNNQVLIADSSETLGVKWETVSELVDGTFDYDNSKTTSFTADTSSKNAYKLTGTGAVTVTFSGSPGTGKMVEGSIILEAGASALSMTWTTAASSVWANGEVLSSVAAGDKYLVSYLTDSSGIQAINYIQLGA